MGDGQVDKQWGSSGAHQEVPHRASPTGLSNANSNVRFDILSCPPGLHMLMEREMPNATRNPRKKLLISSIFWIALCSSTSCAFATEMFEGLWATSKEDCDDQEGPNSRILFDLKPKMKRGKSVPMADGYENHCKIIRMNHSGDDWALAFRCYEFWEDFEASRRPTTSSLKLRSTGWLTLSIAGERYLRCDR